VKNSNQNEVTPLYPGDVCKKDDKERMCAFGPREFNYLKIKLIILYFS
jgi:hypothetical protein